MATFAPQPAEFEYPYYNARVTYDNSLEAAINATEAKANAALPLVTDVSTSANANTFLVPSIYEIRFVVSKALGFPMDAATGILEVITLAPNYNVLQRFTPMTGGSAYRVFFTRRYLDGVWSDWRTFSSQRMDNTAGRAVYTWDETQNREQFVYGDTGWRDISASLAGWDFTGANAGARIVRRGRTVIFEMRGAWQSSTEIFFPVGFRRDGSSSIASSRFQLLEDVPSPTSVPKQPLVDGTRMWVPDLTIGTTYLIRASWETWENWPTSLPGTAVGPIPYI